MSSRPMIRGHVRTPDGQPVAEARVMLASAPGPVPDLVALTAPDGSFALDSVGPGRYRVLAAVDSQAVEVELDLDEDDVEVDVDLTD